MTKDLEHIKSAHQKAFVCRQCNISFSSDHYLKNHIAPTIHMKGSESNVTQCNMIQLLSQRREYVDMSRETLKDEEN